MAHTFVIAEAATTWRYGKDELETARRSIEAAAECGADAWKTQWTSAPGAMVERRKVEADYSRLSWPARWHEILKNLCDKAGTEYMCTVYLIDDIPVIEPFVKRFKVSAYESPWYDFVEAHPQGKEILMSVGMQGVCRSGITHRRYLHCVSEYPCPPERLHLETLKEGCYWAGLSDHTTEVITGALAVACGASLIEKHVKLWSTTPTSDPDYSHSLDLDFIPAYGEEEGREDSFSEYVRLIRLAEKML